MAWSSLAQPQHRVAVNDEVLEVRAVQCRPLAEQWCGNIRAVPWKNLAPLLDEVLLVVLPRLPDVKPAARIPVQTKFAPQEECTSARPISRSGCTRPVVGDACR